VTGPAVRERIDTYAAALVVEWFGEKTGREFTLSESASTSAMGGDAPVYIAESSEGRLALAIARLWEPDTDPAAEAARRSMEARLSAGDARPHVLWAPPRASVPAEDPQASDFVMRVEHAAATLTAGERGEVELPVAIQLAKMRDEGGYASVIGGLSRWWTLITERVDGTFHVNSAQMRRAPQSPALRERLIERIGELSKPLSAGDAIEFDATEAWTVQRLAREPLGERGFAIAQAPPGVDPADGTLMRRIVRKRLKEANAALEGVDADVKGVGLLAIYEYAEHENVGSFVKSLDPGLFARLGLVAAVVDGEVRPVFMPRG
jgi:hypothetical protein